MDLDQARAILELPAQVTLDDVRAAYRRLLRRHHPDVDRGAGAQARTATIIEAYELVVGWAAEEGDPPVLRWPVNDLAPAPGPEPARVRADGPYDVVDAQALDTDTIAVDAPPPETYAALMEAASRVGNIAYVDRQLGIVETMVRFEGGPTCSVVMTLQGRATFTEIFCTMESIEAAPTPPIGPVIDALVEALRELP